jgi:hypothetical protein
MGILVEVNVEMGDLTEICISCALETYFLPLGFSKEENYKVKQEVVMRLKQLNITKYSSSSSFSSSSYI